VTIIEYQKQKRKIRVVMFEELAVQGSL